MILQTPEHAHDQEEMETAAVLSRCKQSTHAEDLMPVCFRCGMSGDLPFMQVHDPHVFFTVLGTALMMTVTTTYNFSLLEKSLSMFKVFRLVWRGTAVAF